MIRHWSACKTEEFHLPGFSKECKFYKTFFKGDGRWYEAVRVFDCDRHFVLQDGEHHVCLMTGRPETIDSERLLQYGSVKICNHICPHKKRKYQKIIEERGQHISLDAIRHIEGYLAKGETISDTML